MFSTRLWKLTPAGLPLTVSASVKVRYILIDAENAKGILFLFPGEGDVRPED